MKTTLQLNTFAVGLPLLILLTYPIVKEGAFFYAMLSTAITGFIQVLLGIKLIFEDPNNRYIQIYIAGVIMFFLLCFIQIEIYSSESLRITLLSLPLILAIYLSIILYKKAKL
ncbi:hypothetical protein KHA90_13425 [Flavobacterium psychroterrae]|uniref:Polysaccharide biosynthesis protein n=1 Tax=Flavobacterium psychroterrae TaxID=2133767 RepID=A0ABS5PE83_9FLAO|nr:hypothetical protein [Flavobacterium psychroterrae]MBS7232026.1 hypothetical protein [Flavobacterium psychroterrae]